MKKDKNQKDLEALYKSLKGKGDGNWLSFYKPKKHPVTK